MDTARLRRALATRSVAGRYDAFLGVGGGLAVLGFILFLLALGGPAADRAWHLFQANWVYFTGLAGGSVAVAAALKLGHARWSGLVLRFAEASAAFFPISLLGLVAIFTLGYGPIYGNMVGQLHALQHGKALWLSHAAMFGRLLVGLIALYLVGWHLVRRDMIPDLFLARERVGGGRRALYERMTNGYDGSEGSIEANEHRLHRLAGIYVVLYALVFTLVAFDGIMALQPHWFSNLFGGWYFMGAFLGGLMLLVPMTLYGERQLGIAHLVSAKQRHDLGKLCFGFTVFWAYLMWAQFQVIWYGNLPEETGFVFSRLWGHWVPVARWVFLGMFVIPFVGLLGVGPKKVRPTLLLVALVSLSALWFERYLLVLPSITRLEGPAFGPPELGPTFLFAGLYLVSYALFARAFPMVSPRLAEITLHREIGHLGVEIFDHEDAGPDFVHEEDVEGESH